MAAPKQEAVEEIKPAKAPTVKLVIYDFDQTITAIHLYHELNELGVDQELALSKMSDERLRQVFGGNGRIKALHSHFGRLKANGIKLAILSYGFVGVIKAALQRMKLFDLYFAESVIIGTDSKQLEVAKGSKAQCIVNEFGSTLKSEEMIFVDDDPYNILGAMEFEVDGKTIKVCHTLCVQPRKGMNQKHMQSIEEIAGIKGDDEINNNKEDAVSEDVQSTNEEDQNQNDEQKEQ